MQKGLFITFEGPEGSGKTTAIKKIEEQLRQEGIDFISTREPGGVDIAEQIRNVILDKKNTAMDPVTEALLYAASRRQHLVEKVIPALNNGQIVLCDRFIDSSIAYQGYARGLGTDTIMQINAPAIGEYMPDLTLYFNVSPEVGLSRINKNKEREINRLDVESREFHKRVTEGYLKTLDWKRTIAIDAEKNIHEVVDPCVRAIRDAIQNHKK